MTTDAAVPAASRSRARRVAVSAAFAAQGFGYATVVTSLPALKDRAAIDDLVVSLLQLGTCVAAAGGSLAADLIAVRWGSRQALAAGLLTQALALVVIALAGDVGALAVAVAIYGLGLGAVDAASNMQGAIVQRSRSKPIFGGFYAAYTSAAIAATLVTGAALAMAAPSAVTLCAAAVVLIAVAAAGLRGFDPARAARAAGSASKGQPLPTRAVVAIGLVVFAAFVVDSAVSSWSTIYLADGLGTSPALTPFGYGAYLVTVLVARLCADAAVHRWGRRAVAVAAAVATAAGGVLVAAVPAMPFPIIGFALMGAAAGLLVPVAFSRAGELLPSRSDEIIARVNLFNYAGAVAGAVILGAVASGAALAGAFLIPVVALVTIVPGLTVLRSSAPIDSAEASPRRRSRASPDERPGLRPD